MWCCHDFHEWWSHEWKSLPYCRSRVRKKLLFMLTHTLLLFLHVIFMSSTHKSVKDNHQSLISPLPPRMQTPPFQHCLHMGNLDSDLDYLLIFRCKHGQLRDAQCHVNMACNQWLETWDVAIIYTGGNKDLCHCSMDVSWLHDIVPSKIKSNLNCCCQLTCDDWGIPNTKLKYYQCTSAALLCCKNTQLFNCIWQIMINEWWIWVVLFILRCYQTTFSSLGCFCAFEILVALATKTDLGAVCTRGVCQGWSFMN